MNTCAKSCASFTVSVAPFFNSGREVRYKILPKPWSYSSIVRMFSSFRAAGKLSNSGAISVNRNAGMLMGLIKAGTLACFSPSMYRERVSLSFQYLGVV